MSLSIRLTCVGGYGRLIITTDMGLERRVRAHNPHYSCDNISRKETQPDFNSSRKPSIDKYQDVLDSILIVGMGQLNAPYQTLTSRIAIIIHHQLGDGHLRASSNSLDEPPSIIYSWRLPKPQPPSTSQLLPQAYLSSRLTTTEVFPSLMTPPDILILSVVRRPASNIPVRHSRPCYWSQVASLSSFRLQLPRHSLLLTGPQLADSYSIVHMTRTPRT